MVVERNREGSDTKEWLIGLCGLESHIVREARLFETRLFETRLQGKQSQTAVQTLNIFPN